MDCTCTGSRNMKTRLPWPLHQWTNKNWPAEQSAKAKVLFWKKFLPGGDSEYSLFPPGDQGVWGGRHISGQRKIPLGHTVTMITLRIGHIAFLRWRIVVFTVARISINLNFNAFNRYSGCPKKMLLSDFVVISASAAWLWAFYDQCSTSAVNSTLIYFGSPWCPKKSKPWVLMTGNRGLINVSFNIWELF